MTSAALSAACSRWGATYGNQKDRSVSTQGSKRLRIANAVQAVREEREVRRQATDTKFESLARIALSQRVNETTTKICKTCDKWHCRAWRAARGSLWATFLTAATAGSTSSASSLRRNEVASGWTRAQKALMSNTGNDSDQGDLMTT